MKFTKMNALGNDYVYIDVVNQEIKDPESLAKRLSDRRFGVGGDGIVLMDASEVADVKMSIYNADGTEAELCGNALRCVAKYAYEHGWVLKDECRIETKAGIKPARVFPEGKVVNKVSVVLGRAQRGFDGEPFYREVTIGQRSVFGYCVGIGNPHYVVFVEEFFDEIPVLGEKIGKRGEIFQNGANVEFVKYTNDGRLIVRVVERGSGETFACGTGAAAVFFCGRELGLVGDRAEISLLGGNIVCSAEQNGDISIEGPVEENFVGEIKDGALWQK